MEPWQQCRHIMCCALKLGAREGCSCRGLGVGGCAPLPCRGPDAGRCRDDRQPAANVPATSGGVLCGFLAIPAGACTSPGPRAVPEQCGAPPRLPCSYRAGCPTQQARPGAWAPKDAPPPQCTRTVSLGSCSRHLSPSYLGGGTGGEWFSLQRRSGSGASRDKRISAGRRCGAGETPRPAEEWRRLGLF